MRARTAELTHHPQAPTGADDRRQVERLIETFVADQLGLPPDDLPREAQLGEDLGADSLDRVEIAMSVEETFDVELPLRAVRRTDTVDDLLTLGRRQVVAQLSAREVARALERADGLGPAAPG